MYFIFNAYGHFEYALSADPIKLDGGLFSIFGEMPAEPDDGADLYLFSDGHQILTTNTPPPSKYHKLIDGQWQLEDNGKAELLRIARLKKLALLNQAAQSFINSVSGSDTVPDFELATWPLQAGEAQAWASDKSAPTPILDGIAAARGVEPEKLKSAALRKALAYSALSAHVAGQRQALQSKIESAKTVAALDKIKIEFTAPEAV